MTPNLIQVFAIILAGVSVAFADALIKQISAESLGQAIKDPMTLVILVLYIFQIILFFYVFMNKWELAIVGNTQMVFYSISVILIGVLSFQEKITMIQSIGIALSLVGVVLMNTY